jgi:hypothetical protein
MIGLLCVCVCVCVCVCECYFEKVWEIVAQSEPHLDVDPLDVGVLIR